MPVAHEDKDRKVIPRWRAFTTTVERGELASVGKVKPRTPSPELVEEQRRAWERERSVGCAADLLASAASVGHAEWAADAAEFLLKRADPLPTAIVRIARRARGQSLLDLDPDSTVGGASGRALVHANIRRYRQRLRAEPRNAVLWVDMARLYETIALTPKASYAMQMALRLAPTNRFVARSAARMLIHHGDPDQAQAVLRRNPRLRDDPWLLAAEIAVSAIKQRGSSHSKDARALLDAGRFPAFHLSELASALGTAELEAGNVKRGRKLIGASLKDPSENAVAQAAWTIRQRHLADVAILVEPAVAASPEAQAWNFASAGKWRDLVASARDWLRQEPYSTRPATMASYYSMIALGDLQAGIAFADEGLVANPLDSVLLNNKVVALAQSGALSEAIATFKRIRQDMLDPNNKIYVVATGGLLALRSGQHTEGRMLYRAAIDAAVRLGQPRAAGMAVAHLALELAEAGLVDAPVVAREALISLDGAGIPEAALIETRLRAIAGALAPPRRARMEGLAM